MQLVPGSWYFGFTCVACHGRIYSMPDKSNGTQPHKLKNAKLRVTCPGCGTTHTYPEFALKSYQVPEGR